MAWNLILKYFSLLIFFYGIVIDESNWYHPGIIELSLNIKDGVYDGQHLGS